MKFLFIIFILSLIFSLIYSSQKSAVSHKAKILKVDSLLRASKQWIAASKSDKDLINKIIHANGGVSYINAARALMSDEELELIEPNLEQYSVNANYQLEECVRGLRSALNEKNKHDLS